MNLRRVGLIVTLAPRTFVLVLFLSLGTLALSIAAQERAGKIHRIGYLSVGTRLAALAHAAQLPPRLRDLGYVEGQNLAFEWRFAEGRPERLPELAADLARLRVDVIVAVANPETLAAKQATSSIPIVMLAAADPVGTGLVASLARPGGNVTGSVWGTPELAAKMVQLLKEVVPTARRLAFLYDPTYPGIEAFIKADEVAARTLGMTPRRVEVLSPEELDAAFAAMKDGHVDALGVAAYGPIALKTIALAAKHRLPAKYVDRFYAHRGGLMSYGPNADEQYRRTARFIDRILKGAKPADLPVEQPMRYELVVNLKTAKALGLTVPQSILMQADQVIE